MRIAFIADGRSEHTRRWISYLGTTGDDILLLSTYPCSEIPGIQIRTLPGIFRSGNSFVKRSDTTQPLKRSRIVSWFVNREISHKLHFWWQQAKVMDIFCQTVVAQKIIKHFQPELIHALRIQNEGYVGALTGFHPLILSSWGSDFIYTAARYPIHRLLTNILMRRADAFTADCSRDIRLAHVYGLERNAQTNYFPGNGGVDLRIFRFGKLEDRKRSRLVVYPRGVSPFYRIDTLLKAIRLICKNDKLSKFILLVQQSSVEMIDIERQKLGLPESQVVVKAFTSCDELANLLKISSIIVSPSISDGTPNSMLEGMACGAFPVMSNLESIREWITHGGNGLLFDPTDAKDLAHCIREALNNSVMRQVGQKVNLALVKERADYAKIMPEARRFYQNIANNWKRSGV